MSGWIFFDCFNTLLDEHDGLTDESGMAPIAHIPVAAGLFDTAEQFHAAYLHWRRSAWPNPLDSVEIPLARRLHTVLGKRTSNDVAPLVAEMVAAFETGYPLTLTLTAGVEAMLDAWQNHARLAVVSNFFIAGGPSALLDRFGLLERFEFVLDSAALGWKKPDRHIYEAALGNAGCTPDEAMFVGDNLNNDVLAPLALGFDGIYLNRRGTRVPGGVRAILDWNEFRPPG